MEITTRTRIQVRHTSNPRALGYSDYPEQGRTAIAEHLASAPDFVGTARQVREYLESLRQTYSGGVFYRVDLCDVRGEKITVDDVRDCLANAEYDRLRRAVKI